MTSMGSPVASGLPVGTPAGWVQGPVLSMPMGQAAFPGAGSPYSTGGVPAALLSGVSGGSPMPVQGSPMMAMPVAGGTPGACAGSPGRGRFGGTPPAQAQRQETELTLKDLDGTSTVGTAATTRSGKKPKKAKKTGKRCMCF
mmetsp:Transcript_37772/g.67307  ORF Transcript_37772/g.67307 Transcript_37772/m.67307 type:complete len:142 (+) Transcript_37772:1-426(+)